MYSTYHAHEIIKRITEQYVCNACILGDYYSPDSTLVALVVYPGEDELCLLFFSCNGEEEEDFLNLS